MHTLTARDNDYSDFPARSYLQDFFTNLGPQNKQILQFLHDTYQRIPKVETMVEIGGGPTIYQLISASEKVESIVFTEFASSAREEITKFLKDNNDAFDWNGYIRYVLELEGRQQDDEAVRLRKRQIQEKVVEVLPCDVRNANPLAPETFMPFDVLQMLSVVDAVANTVEELERYLRNVLSLLRKDGYFVARFVNSSDWETGGHKYKSFPITEDLLRQVLPRLGIQIEVMSPIDIGSDYNYYLINVFARKRAEVASSTVSLDA